MNSIRHYIALAVIVLAALPALAQSVPDSTTTNASSSRRFITPVKENTNKTLLPGKNVGDKELEQYLTGDTAKFIEEQRQDSIKRNYKRYPRLTDMAVGFNFMDLILAAAGQDYMNVDASFTLNMWNRIQPVGELGVGWANSTPDALNFTYKGNLSPYMRLGANYNFMFKNSPDYQALLGLRLGGSIFKYGITHMEYHNSYWDETASPNILGQKGRALWMEVTAGLKVKIWRQVSLGWMVRYHNLLGENKANYGKPWFIPGYGTRNSKFSVAFNVYYTLPLGYRPNVTSKDEEKEKKN